ncbi:MAG: DUF2721 domain-containing protein [Flavihumibacter sp.]|nr:DUF2721 domain-containing protein [Flavihumibacter sp.]
MEITINTPALLFPAISLLMLAFTNRFLALANLIRNLHEKYKLQADKTVLLQQIKNLRLRLRLIRSMQWFGIFSLFLCVLSMFFIYEQLTMAAGISFAASLVCMLVSLFISLSEIQISTRALEIELSDMELEDTNPIMDYFKSGLTKKEKE